MKFKAVLLLLVFFAFACKKEKGAGIPTSGVLTTGTWVVSKLSIDGTNITDSLSSYTFVFDTNHGITAASALGTTIGEWYIETDDDSEFRIVLGDKAPLNNLSKIWHVRSESESKVELYDDEDGRSDELTFNKQ